MNLPKRKTKIPEIPKDSGVFRLQKGFLLKQNVQIPEIPTDSAWAGGFSERTFTLGVSFVFELYPCRMMVGSPSQGGPTQPQV